MIGCLLLLTWFASDAPTNPRVVEIPVAQQKMPEQYGGLRFQLQHLAGKRSSRIEFKPSGPAVFHPDGRLLVGFPEKSLIIAFAKDTYDTSRIGQKYFGGNDELILLPEILSFADGLVYSTNSNDKQVVAYDATWEPIWGGRTRYPGTQVGDGRKFMASRPGDGFHLLITNHLGKIMQAITLPGLPTLDQKALPLVLDYQGVHGAVVLNGEGTQLYRLNGNGKLLMHLKLKGKHGAVKAVRMVDDHYWLLLHHDAGKRATLLQLDKAGKPMVHYRLPFAANAMDATVDEVAVTLTSEGVVRSYKLR